MLILVLLVVIGVTWSLLYIKPRSKYIIKRSLLTSSMLDAELKYQILSLLLAFLTLALVFGVAPDSFSKYFSFGNISAPVIPVPLIGLNPGKDENWLHVGINFSVIIPAIGFIFCYINLIRGRKLNKLNYSIFLWIVIFSLMNSFTEEMITRFSVVVLLDGIISSTYIYLISGFIFGTVHYYGTPGKIPGVLLAGFLGWLLAKSIGETQGIFWAWFIHFLGDVIIFTALFLQPEAQEKKQ